MIHVSIGMWDGHIISIECKGHAGYAESGKDLVCAGVSSILFGALNALDEMEKEYVRLRVTNSKISIRVLQDNEHIQLLLKMILIQLETVRESYQEYIEIKKLEVQP
ncbi:MAG: ribosomal-processing cysteine protease Prp [Erysipelotrichaceae bacterium]|nr:ribosomal-processing cysteine protease Prp [Erysipelotrichaceae bacterium]